MTCLPLIARELRARARNRAFYRVRLVGAVLGVVICTAPLLSQMLVPATVRSPPLTAYGQTIFHGLVAIAFTLCCTACFWTADAITAEKRGGTLGLLFLTRVRELDLLLGKFGSAGLTGLCSLLAFLPMLMIPLLVGGLTGGEVARKSLLLANTLFLALAAGMCESAGSKNRSSATWRTILLLGAIVLLPYLLTRGVGFAQSGLGFISPLCGLEYADDLAYKTTPRSFWVCLAATHGLSWMLVAGAAYHLRRSVRRTEDGGAAALLQESTSAALSRPRRPLVLGDLNPVEWLLRRQMGVRMLFWFAAAIAAAHYVWWEFSYQRWYAGSVPAFGVVGLQTPWLIARSLSCLLIATGACRFAMQARAEGEIELLLTAGLKRADLISGQWEGIKRLLAGPLGLLVLLCWLRLIFPQGLRAGFRLSAVGPGGLFNGDAWDWLLEQFLPAATASLVTVTGVMAVCWLAMDSGMRARNQFLVLLRCVWLAAILRWLIYLAAYGYGLLLISGGLQAYTHRLQSSGRRPFPAALATLAAQLSVLLYDLWLIHRARRRLGRTLGVKEPVALSFRWAPRLPA